MRRKRRRTISTGIIIKIRRKWCEWMSPASSIPVLPIQHLPKWERKWKEDRTSRINDPWKKLTSFTNPSLHGGMERLVREKHNPQSLIPPKALNIRIKQTICLLLFIKISLYTIQQCHHLRKTLSGISANSMATTTNIWRLKMRLNAGKTHRLTWAVSVNGEL